MSAVNVPGPRSPADHSIVLLGSIGGVVMLVTVSVATLITGAAPAWAALGPAGAALLSALAWRCWRLVRRHGFYHAPEGEDGGEDAEGGTGIRFPPPDPFDGDDSLEFDWDGFLTEFWDYVEARQQRQRSLVSASSGPAGARSR